MGWLDFFRKKEEEVVEVKKIPLKDVDPLVEEELAKEEAKVGEIREKINEKIKRTITVLCRILDSCYRCGRKTEWCSRRSGKKVRGVGHNTHDLCRRSSLTIRYRKS